MSRKLAIKGHPTRGNEVIEILEMLGGKNIYKLLGNDRYPYCVIEGCQNEIRVGEYIFGNEDIYLFTLEEFLEKYPFKVGDKVVYTKYGDNCDDYPVTIESMKWTGTTIEYTFDDCGTCLAKDLKMWKSKDNHTNVSTMKRVLTELFEHIKTTPKEELEREFEEIKEWSNVGPAVEEFRTFCECVNKKPVYPKTYEECCNELINHDKYREIKVAIAGISYKADLITSFTKLLICRDAYWKIAGEEMGLDEPWKPDYNDLNNITYYGLYNELKYSIINPSQFVFPTAEMRDAFYENFKDLIESCKKLL